MFLPVKIVIPQHRKKLSWGECQNVPPSNKYRKKLNVFYTCILWSVGTGSLRTAAILSSISCSHYDFLHKPIKNNLFNAPITEQFIFHQQ